MKPPTEPVTAQGQDIFAPKSTEPKTPDELLADRYGDGDNPDDMDSMVQFRTPEARTDVLSLPTVQMSQEEFSRLSTASGAELQDYIDANGLTGVSQAIVAVEGAGPRVIDTTVEDFGTTDRAATDRLLETMNASEQEVADGSESAATINSPNEVNEDVHIYSSAELKAMADEARQLAVSEVTDSSTPVAEREPETKQDKYNELKKQIADLISESGISDNDAFYVEQYAKAGDARYDEQTTYLAKMSPGVRSNTTLIQRYKDLYDDKEAIMRG